MTLLVLTGTAIPAQTFTTLFGFHGTDGTYPVTALVQGIDGNLYGTAQLGGATHRGTIFAVTPGGLQLSYSFCGAANCTDGAQPNAGLVQDLNGNLYGTTSGGGVYQFGTVFKISPAGGTLTTLYSFCAQTGCTDGKYPNAGLIRAPGGEFYGTTQNGGANGLGGTIFKINPNGTFATVYSFCALRSCQDGWDPSILTLGQGGDLYGVTAYGGAGTRGTVFRITPDGILSVLHSFCIQAGCPDGSYPVGPLVQTADGNFYGTTATGGAMNGGTFFRISPAGTLTTLYNFCSQAGCTDGLFPGPVIQATDGNFYGNTIEGGFTVLNKKGEGTLFRISPGGVLTTLYTFCTVSCSIDGSFPGALLQRTDGDFYGTTEYGGAGNAGTVFRLSAGLGPFVRPQPAVGKPGALVEILGTNLTGATGVTFNGVAAEFQVIGSSLITSLVPAGAASGKIEVVTPTGTLMSNVNFEVIP